MDRLISVSLELIYRKARCMDGALVLSDEVSIRVEELLIIRSVEAIHRWVANKSGKVFPTPPLPRVNGLAPPTPRSNE